MFANNNASVSGGAIYADSTSSSETYVDLLNALSGVGTRKRCFLTLDPDTRVDYEYSSHQAKVYVVVGITRDCVGMYTLASLCLSVRLSARLSVQPSVCLLSVCLGVFSM